MAPRLSHAAATRRHQIIDGHGLTTINSQGRRVLNIVNDTQAKWLAAHRDVCAAEGKEVKLTKKWTNNMLRMWYKEHPTPPSLDNIAHSDISFGAVKEILREYQRSFINITNITDNITLPFPHQSWINELSQQNNEACKVIRFLKYVFDKSATLDDCREVLQELKREFGIMLPTEFDAKYNDIIKRANRFGCFGEMNWKTVLFLEHAEFPLAEKEQRYPPLADIKKAFRDEVNSHQYGFVKALVFDEGQRQRRIVRKGLEHESFYGIIKPHRDKSNAASFLKHYHRAKDVIAENNSNLHCALNCPHCALFRRSDTADTASADDTSSADDTDVSTSVEQGT